MMRLKIKKLTILIFSLVFISLIACGNNTSSSSKSTLSDADAVAEDSANLEVTLGGTDTDVNNVTTSLVLLTTGENGSTITWSSSNTAVIANDGTVTRPAYTAADATVTLTATITLGTETSTQTFTVTVIKAPQTDAEAITADKANLVDTTIQGTNTSLSNVTSNLVLPATGSSGSSITWVSSNTTVIANNGTVTRPVYGSSNATLTVTATISKGSFSETKVFNIVVLETPVVDTTIPTVSAATITTSLITPSSLTLTWNAASDDVTSTGNLKYKLVKATTSAAIDTAAEIDAITGADLIMDWTTAALSKNVTGLTTGATYYFNVLVKDSANNQNKYTVINAVPGISWTDLMPGGINRGTSASHSVSLKIYDASNIYVSFLNYTTSPARLVVHKYDGTSWTQLGNINTNCMYGSMELYQDGTPFVAISGDGGLFVLGWNGTAWGESMHVVGSFRNVKLFKDVVDQKLYLITSDQATGNILIYKYNGTAWESKTPPSGSLNDIYDVPDAYITNGNIYLSFKNGPDTIKTMYFNGTLWVDYGTPSTIGINDLSFFNGGTGLGNSTGIVYGRGYYRNFSGGTWGAEQIVYAVGSDTQDADIIINASIVYVSCNGFKGVMKSTSLDGTSWTQLGSNYDNSGSNFASTSMVRFDGNIYLAADIGGTIYVKMIAE